MKSLVTLLASCLVALAACSKEPGAPAAGTSSPASPAAPAASADLPKGERTYYFGGQEKHTNISFEGLTEVLRIMGSTKFIEGSATVDFEAGKAACELKIPVIGLRTGMDARDRVMQGKAWLDERNHPYIEFKSANAAFTKPVTWALDGTIFIHGVPQDLRVKADVRPIDAALGRELLGPGDWVKVSVSFPVKLSGHGITIPPDSLAQVNDVWTISVDLFGTSEKPSTYPKPMGISDVATRSIRPAAVTVEGVAGKRYAFGEKFQLVNIAAESKTPLETVIASTNVCGGILVLDAEKGAGKVKLSLPVGMLKTGIALRDEHMQGPDWMDVKKFRDIFYESTQLSRKDQKTWIVDGLLTIKGIPKPVRAEVEMRQLTPEQMRKAKWADAEGLRFLTTFKIKLSDYRIGIPKPAAGKVNDQLTLSVDLIAVAKEPE